MATIRPAAALDPRSFGRRARATAPAQPWLDSAPSSDDLRLFAVTFAAGFLFVSVLIA